MKYTQGIMLVYFIPFLSEKSYVGFPISILSCQTACLPAWAKFLFLAVRQHRHKDLSEHMKASFSQSEDVFSKSHITNGIV